MYMGNRFESQPKPRECHARTENIEEHKGTGPGPGMNSRQPGMCGFVFICGPYEEGTKGSVGGILGCSARIAGCCCAGNWPRGGIYFNFLAGGRGCCEVRHGWTIGGPPPPPSPSRTEEQKRSSNPYAHPNRDGTFVFGEPLAKRAHLNSLC